MTLSPHYAGHGAPYYGRGTLERLVEPAFRDLSRLRDAGARAELVLVDVPHHDTARFEPCLEKAADWLTEI